MIVVAKINLTIREIKPFTNKKANRQEKKRKSVKYFVSELPLSVHPFIHACVRKQGKSQVSVVP